MAEKGSIGKGLLLGVALTILGLAASFVYLPAIIAFGVYQYLWIMPVYVMYGYRGEPETAKGVLLASLIGIVLTAAFWVLMFMDGFRPF
jgi:hypothetical protein